MPHDVETKLLRVAARLLAPRSGRGVATILAEPARLAEPAPPASATWPRLRRGLARGVTRWLARADWRRKPRWVAGRLATCRLWRAAADEVSGPDDGLHFSPNTLELLRWLAAADLEAANLHAADLHAAERLTIEPPPLTLSAPLAAGDDFLLFRAWQTAATDGRRAALARQDAFRRHALCRLCRPLVFAASDLPPVDFAPYTRGARAVFVTACADELAEAWAAAERAFPRETPAATLAAARETQTLLDGLAAALEAANRRDLAAFLLAALQRLLATPRGERSWPRWSPPAGLALARRAELLRAAWTFWRFFPRLAAWRRWAGAVGRVDDDHPAARLFLECWESRGGDAAARVLTPLLEQLDRAGWTAPPPDAV